MTYSLILFDCDGTLVDSEYLNLKAIIELIEECGATGYDIEYGMHHFSGHRFSQIIGKISTETGIIFPKDAGKRYLEKVRALAPKEMKPVEGARQMVEAANDSAIIYVVSNGERTNVITSLEFGGLKPFFPDERIISGAMSSNPKPAPDLFLLACEKEHIPPSDTLVIEDSVAGVTAARAGGMDVWGFCGTHHDPDAHKQKLMDAGAAHVFMSMHDLLGYFKAFHIK
ncbi:MAG: HAD family hydrolase [Alphaproteobacteria bacterium]